MSVHECHSPGFRAPQSAHVPLPGTVFMSSCSVRSFRACWRLFSADAILLRLKLRSQGGGDAVRGAARKRGEVGGLRRLLSQNELLGLGDCHMVDGVRTGVRERKGSSKPNVLRDALAITDPRTSRSPRHHPNMRKPGPQPEGTGDGKHRRRRGSWHFGSNRSRTLNPDGWMPQSPTALDTSYIWTTAITHDTCSHES